MKRWGILVFVILLLVAAGLTVRWWLTPLLELINAKTDLIQGLADAIQIALWIIAGIAGLIAFARSNKKSPEASPSPTNISAQKKVADGSVLIEGGVQQSNIVTGKHNTIIQAETYVDKQIIGKPSAVDPKALRQAYLNRLFESARQLSLAGVDPKAASDPMHAGRLDLDAVYTALLTLSLRPERNKNTPSLRP